MKKFMSTILLIILCLMPLAVISCNNTPDDKADDSEIEATQSTEQVAITEKNTFNISDFTIIAPARGTKLQELAISFLDVVIDMEEHRIYSVLFLHYIKGNVK